MATKKKLLENRMPLYLGGLLLGLAVMVAIFKMKRAMMPKFHPIQDERPEAVIAPGGSIRFIYTDDPGYFMIPGLPSGAVVSRRKEDGSLAPIIRASYGDLVEKEPALGPLSEEGKYNLSAELYLCAEPGAADCAKYRLEQDIKVEREATSLDDRLEVDLARLGQEGLKAGPMSVDPDRIEKETKDNADTQ